MDNDNFSFLADAESSITGDKTEGYTPKEQELIHQLVQERLGKKNAIEFESLDDYVVPPKMFFSMIKKPAVSIRANRMEFSMSAIRLFEGVQHVLPMLSENKKRMVVAICAEEEISSIEWARLKKDKWVNRSISCPEYVQRVNVSRVLKFFLDSLRDDLKPIEILRFYCYNINSNLSEVRKVGVAPHTPLGAPLWCMLSAGKCTELSHTGKCDL